MKLKWLQIRYILGGWGGTLPLYINIQNLGGNSSRFFEAIVGNIKYLFKHVWLKSILQDVAYNIKLPALSFNTKSKSKQKMKMLREKWWPRPFFRQSSSPICLWRGLLFLLEATLSFLSLPTRFALLRVEESFHSKHWYSSRPTFPQVFMLGESSYQTLFETAPPDSLYGKLWKTKFEDKERWLYDMICPSCGFNIFCKYFPSME